MPSTKNRVMNFALPAEFTVTPLRAFDTIYKGSAFEIERLKAWGAAQGGWWADVMYATHDGAHVAALPSGTMSRESLTLCALECRRVLGKGV